MRFPLKENLHLLGRKGFYFTQGSVSSLMTLDPNRKIGIDPNRIGTDEPNRQ